MIDEKEVAADAKRTAEIACLERLKVEVIDGIDRLDIAQKAYAMNRGEYFRQLAFSHWRGFVYGMGFSAFVVLFAYWWSHA